MDEERSRKWFQHLGAGKGFACLSTSLSLIHEAPGGTVEMKSVYGDQS